MSGLRKKFWLLGTALATLEGRDLPKKRAILLNLLHFISETRCSVRVACAQTYALAVVFWEKAGIPTLEKRTVIKKIEDLHSEYYQLRKSAKRGPSQRITRFESNLDSLFDIAHQSAAAVICDEDKKFLQKQRLGEFSKLGLPDKELAAKVQRKMERQSRGDRWKRSGLTDDTSPEILYSSSTSDYEEDEDGMNEDDAFLPSTRTATPLLNRFHIMSPKLSNTLDRTAVSCRQAAMILASHANTTGQTVSKSVLSKSTIHRERRKHRSLAASAIRDQVTADVISDDVKLTVHWDGKLLPESLGGKKVDRLPVIVTGQQVEQLLGVPKIEHGTGEAMAEATYRLLLSWGFVDRVVGLCFDTTASNTGAYKGACRLLEDKIERPLVRLACVHHVKEVMAADVNRLLNGQTDAPYNTMCERFRKQWSTLSKTTLDMPLCDFTADNRQQPDSLFNNQTFRKLRRASIAYLRQLVADKQRMTNLRGDYREMALLALHCLNPQEGTFQVNKPGATSNARWMSRIIYSFKIVMFRSQFDISHEELTRLVRFNVFIALVYVQSWFSVECAADQPYNDLLLMRRLIAYRDIDSMVCL
jgi:hypothetical protein